MEMETPSGFLMRNSVGAHRRASFFIPVLIINACWYSDHATHDGICSGQPSRDFRELKKIDSFAEFMDSNKLLHFTITI